MNTAALNPRPQQPLARSWQRPFYGLAGALSLALAGIGAVLPVMPTTVFLILAAACFCRSSPRLERWMLNHPRFGATLRAWRASGAISREAKLAACLGMGAGLALFLWRVPAPWVSDLGTGAILLSCALFILSRPSPRPGITEPVVASYGQSPKGWRSWGVLLSLAVHVLVLLLALWQWRSPAPAPKPNRTELVSLQLLPAAAPQVAVQEREALEEQKPAPEPAKPESPKPKETATEASQAAPLDRPTPPLPPTDHGLGRPESAAKPAAAPPEATAAAAPVTPSLPPAPQPVSAQQQSWEGQVLARLERFRSYPSIARAQRAQGVVYVRLRLNRGGQLLSATLEQSSGHASLDRAALATVMRANPLPAIPPELPDEVALLVPIEYFLT